MIVFIGFVALLNLGLGFAVAILASNPWPQLAWPRVGRPSTASLPPEVQPTPEAPTQLQPVVVDRMNLPFGWQERLALQQVIPRSLFEAVLHIVRIDGDAQRTRWTKFESSLRDLLGEASSEDLAGVATPVIEESKASLTWCNDLLQWLDERREELSSIDCTLSEQLRELLFNLTSRLEPLQHFQPTGLSSSDVDQAVRTFLREFAGAYESSCQLREFVLECLSIDAQASDRLDLLPNAWQKDSVTGLPNRLGIEVLLADWSAADPSHKRLVSVAMIEIDRLGKLNERLGILPTNYVVRAFARLVEGVVRSDRGDRVARVGAGMFVLLPDAGVAGAKAAAERIRQTIEAATFQCAGEDFTLAANCAVTDFLFEDSAAELIKRLQIGVAEAKRGGRNRTAIDEGSGPVLFDAQPVHVKARTINVNDV